jgi:GNAT superfamily N-acetyltransferase
MANADLTIREYRPADRPFLAWAVRGSSRTDRPVPTLAGEDRWSRWVAEAADELHAHRRDPDWVILMAEWRGSWCGLVAGRRVPVSERIDGAPAGRGVAGAFVELYVDPWFRGMGVGHALVEATELCLRGLGCAWLAPLRLPGGPAAESTRREFGFDARWEHAGRSLIEPAAGGFSGLIGGAGGRGSADYR